MMTGNPTDMRVPTDGVATLGGADTSHADAVVAHVHRLLTDHLHIAAASFDSDIVDSGALDSFALVELLATLEDEFDVEIPVEDLEVDHFRTARCIAALIAART